MRPISLPKHSTNTAAAMLTLGTTKENEDINDLYSCSRCAFAADCPQKNVHNKCPFIGDCSISLDREGILKLQTEIIRSQLIAIRKLEALQAMGRIDGTDTIDKLRKGTFDLLEKLKKDPESLQSVDILEKLGITDE